MTELPPLDGAYSWRKVMGPLLTMELISVCDVDVPEYLLK
jgi:hypothetical protein